MFSSLPQPARICVTPYHDNRKPHLKWTIAGHYIKGKRVRRFFPTKGEAETFVQRIQIKAQNLGSRALHIDPSLHVMAVECHDQLAPYGKTIRDATKFYRQHLETIKRSCTVEELIAGFLQNKEGDGRRERYLSDLRTRLGRFERDFGHRTVATITTTECDDWLRAFPLSAQSRNNYRRVLSTFFSYAVVRRYCPENPIAQTARAKVTDKPVEVFTPEQVRRLLESADPDILPALAIGAFAGLRPAEIERLDWKEVKLDRGFIEVSAAKSKTASRRLVSIQPNLKAWLERATIKAGLVQPPNFRKKVDAARARARFEAWPPNVLRHSFASYHLAKFQDAAALALQLGHTTTGMLFAHYREIVTPDDAESYWRVVPVGSGSSKE